MTDETLRRVVGGVFFAIGDAIGPAALQRANQSLVEFAQDNADDPAAADLCMFLAECAQPRADYTWLDDLLASAA
jgi:hypothetical protein